jgi:hypothetical protein
MIDPIKEGMVEDVEDILTRAFDICFIIKITAYSVQSQTAAIDP